MIGYWLSFALILLFIPIGLDSFIVCCEKKNSFSDAQKKNARLNVAKYWLFYWLCDLFYMSCFIDNLACKYVFGLIILIVIFTNLSIAFSSPKAKNGFDRFGMIQDFLVGIGLTIYLIYIIPDSSLQTIVTAVVAAVYGGLITLVGVAWTIKKSDKDRKADEILKAKPVFSFNPQLKEGLIDGSNKACFTPIDYADGFSCEAHAEIENSNKSSFCLNKIFHDGKWFQIEGNKILLPSGKCYFVFDFSDALNIVLSVNDSLGNEYLYVLKVLMMTPTNGIGCGFTSTHKIFYTLREIEEMSKDDFNKLITSKRSKESGKDGAK